MDEYTWSVKPGRLARYAGRNPLVRTSDRLEAWTVLIAVLVAVLAIPFAATIGTLTYERQVQLSVRQAAELRQVAATVIADSTPEAQPGRVWFRTQVRWSVGTEPTTGWLEGADRLNAGDRATVWVNDRGEQVGPPLSREQASVVAIGIAALAWLAVVVVLSTSVRVVHWHLERSRYEGWTREWRTFDCDGNGRRKNRPA